MRADDLFLVTAGWNPECYEAKGRGGIGWREARVLAGSFYNNSALGIHAELVQLGMLAVFFGHRLKGTTGVSRCIVLLSSPVVCLKFQ